MRNLRLLAGWCAALALAACAAPVPSPSATTSPTSSPVPSPSVAPSPNPAAATARICGRLDAPTCAQVVEMVRRFQPAAFMPDTIAVADYDCPPGGRCRAGFGALVVLVQPGWTDIADLPAFTLFGWSGPERVQEWPYPYLPDHIVALLPGRTAGP